MHRGHAGLPFTKTTRGVGRTDSDGRGARGLTTMILADQKLTAAQVILMAADELMAAGAAEFSEWDLTVASWSRDRFRFGLRGYAQTYPDHKRVMMEIMGAKASNPVSQKYMEKVRPNYYKLTPLGRTVAARLRGEGPKPSGVKPVTVKDLYDTAAAYVSRPEFRRWQDNPEEPREWAAAAAFLGLAGKGVVAEPARRVDEIYNAIRAAIDWCNAQEVAFLTRGAGGGGLPIHVRDLVDLIDFLQALKYRFPDHLETEPAGKVKKRFRD